MALATDESVQGESAMRFALQLVKHYTENTMQVFMALIC